MVNLFKFSLVVFYVMFWGVCCSMLYFSVVGVKLLVLETGKLRPTALAISSTNTNRIILRTLYAVYLFLINRAYGKTMRDIFP